MKKILLFLALIIFFSCNTEKNKIKNPSFLIGNWIRINSKDSATTHETWHKDLTGFGITIKGKDTVFFEEIKIINKNDTLFLKVSGVNETPTLFKFTSQTDTSFTCENLKNEFPKKIKYWLDDDLLKAKVSNDDFVIEFIFEKIAN